jgi:hypothetical protein
MSITKLQKKVKILELLNKIKDSECQKEMRNLSLERVLMAETINKKEIISGEINELDSQLYAQANKDISTFNFQQKFNYASWLQQQDKTLDVTLDVSKNNISNMENQLKNILKQTEKINEKIECTKNELNQCVEHKFILDSK